MPNLIVAPCNTPTQQVLDFLNLGMEKDPLSDLDWLLAEKKAGRINFFKVKDFDTQKIVGAMAVRIDQSDFGSELVCVCAGGNWSQGSLYDHMTPYLEALAKNNNCAFLRGHTSRKGIGKLMERNGWELAEYVYRKRV